MQGPRGSRPELTPVTSAINLIGSAVTLSILGVRVGSARKEYGVELPTLYAPGNTEKERLFNCVQRGHQQAFESYPQYLAMALLTGLAFPVTTALEGALWIAARFAWADGYATGKPDNRYRFSWLGRHIWTPLIHFLVLDLYIAGRLLAGL